MANTFIRLVLHKHNFIDSEYLFYSYLAACQKPYSRNDYNNYGILYMVMNMNAGLGAIQILLIHLWTKICH